ncbi:putative membrane copper amine oxidase, partial [Aureobasidium melanogenum]
MKFSMSLLLVGFVLHANDVLSAPSPDPKAAWVRQSRARKAASRVGKRWSNGTSAQPAVTSCSDNNYTQVLAPKVNVWGGLTDVEAASVTRWLFAQPEFNLTVSDEAGEWDNTILLVELMHPNKTDVLDYLDNAGPVPDRYAHVVLDHRACEEPYYEDILVGPIESFGVKNGTTRWEPLEYPYTRKTAGRVRNLDADADDTLYSHWIYKISATISDITLDLWGGTALGLDNDTLSIWGIDPLWQDDGRVVRWDAFWSNTVDDFDAQTLMPLGLYFRSDVTGRDPSQWKLEGWYYNGVFYETTEAFRSAYYTPGFVKLGANVEGDWARTDQIGPVLPLDTAHPPASITPNGARFAVDAESKWIQWMDFSFFVGYQRDTGLSLWDIRYKGERVLYELGLQEALAHYAGQDPVQSGTAYLDSYYGFGPYAFELVKGYDCPAYATYLNTSFYVSETTHTHLNSLCLFEYTADYPLQRHSTSDYVSVTKNTYFTIRSVSTVGNYDYMFSYSFYMDGSINVEVRASGYIQSAYYANNEEYGYKIHDNLSGSMHDHVLNFKADFDIQGTNNTVAVVNQIPVSATYPWSKGKARNTMKLEKSYIETEDASRLFWGANSATQYSVINKDAVNKYGEYRGYRISPSIGAIHLTVEDSSNLANAARWANHDIQVTKQHDTEPRAAHAYNNQDVHDPPINFDAFFNGENLTQTDLVLWLNLGMHHIPYTGDLPNTVFSTAHAGLSFSPLNYLDGDPSRQTVNQVRIDYGGGNVSAVKTFGQEQGSCAVEYSPVEVDLWGYKGDVVVRKFPFDPNNPYYETDAIV